MGRTFAVAGVVTVLLTGCLEYEGNGSGVRVAVVGNSIVDRSRTEIKSSLNANGFSYHVSAEGGIAIPAARERLLPPVYASKPEVLVIELGINDAMTGWNSADLPHLERILKDLDAVPCVIWVTPDAQDPGPTWWDGAAHDGSTLNERLALFEASLLKRLPKHPTVHHADWGELQLDEYYEADLLHPSPAGSLAFASYLSERIAALC